MTPFYKDEFITLYNACALDVFGSLPDVSMLLLTDPPYGIGMDKGIGGGTGYSGLCPRNPRKYKGGWDDIRQLDIVLQAVRRCDAAIVWGGQFYASVLPMNGKWLFWDKCQTMPSYGDGELAWTNLRGNAVKMFRYNGNGLQAVEKTRIHPTQKPVALMRWCIEQAEKHYRCLPRLILDPFCGSGSTLVAAKQMGIPSIGIEADEEICQKSIERLAVDYLPL